MKTLLLALLFVSTLRAQSDSPNVILSGGQPNVGYTTILHYTGSNNDYICSARSNQPTLATITISTVSNANPGSATATGHGFYFATGIAQKIVVYISGATGGWVTMNGVHILTPTSANALALDIDTTAFGAWGAQVVTVVTRAPNTLSSIWAVRSLMYDASNNLTMIANAATKTGTSGLDLGGGSTAYQFTCAAPTAVQ